MKRRRSFDGTHQSRALRDLLVWSQRSLRTRSGRTLQDLAKMLAMSPATLARYMNGTTPLGSEQFAPFAAAFETTEADLIAGYFPVTLAEADDPDWDFLAELKRLWPTDPEAVERTYHGLREAPQDIQRTVISEIRRVLEDEQPRAVPAERVDYRAEAAG